VGITVAPGDTAIPPSAGPPEFLGTGGPERGSNRPAAEGSGPTDGRSGEDARSGSDGATATGSPDSAEPGDPSAASDRSADEADASDLGYDEAPIRSTAYDLPGFDAVASLAALAAATLLARRRGRGS
jgi:PGF-CTERM protein